MHLLAREVRSLDEDAVAEDLGHAPADIVFLSFSDSDLLALRAAADAVAAGDATVRITSLSRLLHPMSIDLYVADTLMRSRCVVVRLLGGMEYWRYGVEELSRACRDGGIPLALVAGDARPDPRLAALSTIPAPTLVHLDALLRAGGPRNMATALRLMAGLARQGDMAETAPDTPPPETLPPAGLLRAADPALPLRAGVVFYRSHLLAGDIAPILALSDTLAHHGIGADLFYVASLKDRTCAAMVHDWLTDAPPDVIVNVTFFSARGEETDISALDIADVPVIQALQPGVTQAAWRDSTRGLSQADLAMQVVLPELDGRMPGAPISFKEETAPGLPARHVPYPPGLEIVAARAEGWARLSHLSPAARRVAIVLSDYPGAQRDGGGDGQAGHAVGLDSFASLSVLLTLLRAEGYDTGNDTLPDSATLAHLLARAPATPFMTLARYEALLATLPREARDALSACWGTPAEDPSVVDGALCLRHLTLGHVTMALQPDRGSKLDRKSWYHDPDTPPRHAYVAFYLWLRHGVRADAMVHLGTHGTLEWLPGKAAAPSARCWPTLLAGGMPVLYPFIVNNPGEAATARRRLGAVTIGHMTPPVMAAGHGDGRTAELERLIDEYAAADGLDRRRGAILRGEILQRAGDLGLLDESGPRPDEDEDEALARLDAYLCDVKDLQIRDGLHVFGRPPPHARALATTIALACGADAPADLEERLHDCGAAEASALLRGLDGRMVPPGPSGAPTRGRADVLPTGRNLFAMDPRAIPTRSAVVLAQRAADLLLEGHLQDEGDHLSSIIIDLWGSSSLRTGGEDLALALLLMGTRPVWDSGSGRVRGIEVIPMAVLDRPRVDVTLRISGLFRDAFAGQIALFEQAVQAIADRDEDPALNPLAHGVRGLTGAARLRATARIFGTAPGCYGTGIEDMLARDGWDGRDDLGRAWMAGSAWTYGGTREGTRDDDAMQRRIRAADVMLHVQDHAEIDILESPDIAAHAGGMAAAAAALGRTPRMLHGDTSRPDTPRLRATAQEVARVVRGRLTNPAWLAGMRRHGYRGAAEIARGVATLHAFAATVPARFDRQFDLVFAAIANDAEMDRFLATANPDARAAIRHRLAQAQRQGLWRPRSNSAAMLLDPDA
ncbi:cobaltochelatase subunit CobN [Gluconacetobacter entanii]|uniref:Cobaltochelatase subunit CobN n=1 Tax=Gluconacetobacter entanii TaxID=108528 RepID=A0A318PX59_9PROT|nr:cobaltochelatase subunit CobN [Gluconacetobacter entanii]PYD63665.1 cobaltochelatase subunit CobN [Gluconacetobacter entanii]